MTRRKWIHYFRHGNTVSLTGEKKDKVVSTGFDLTPSRSMREATRGFEIMNFFGSGSGK